MPVDDRATKSGVQTHPPSEEEAAVQPSGPRGDNPATAGPGQTGFVPVQDA